MPVADFPQFYSDMSENDKMKIKSEYNQVQLFANSLCKTCHISKRHESMNRYTNIAPFDENRVVLNQDEFENEYINASYVDVGRCRIL